QVSIAKAIPSLLEPCRGHRRRSQLLRFQSRKRFRHCWSQEVVQQDCSKFAFQSRKRFRHCWSDRPGRQCGGFHYCFNRESDSVTVEAVMLCCRTVQNLRFNRESDSVTVGATDLVGSGSVYIIVSIAKAIPSLLERACVVLPTHPRFSFNRESDSVTVGACTA